MTPNVFLGPAGPRARWRPDELRRGESARLPRRPYATENIPSTSLRIPSTSGIACGEPRILTDACWAFAQQHSRQMARHYAGNNPSDVLGRRRSGLVDDNRQNDALHNHVNTRAELKAYDPLWLRSARRVRRRHLALPEAVSARSRRARASADFNPAQAPRFQWRAAPIPSGPRADPDRMSSSSASATSPSWISAAGATPRQGFAAFRPRHSRHGDRPPRSCGSPIGQQLTPPIRIQRAIRLN